MKRTYYDFVLVAMLGVCASPVAARADTLVVVNKSDFQVVLVDPATDKVLVKLPTGHGPHEVAISRDGRTAYVGNFGLWNVYPAGDQTHTLPGNTITVLDLAARKVKATFDLGSNRGPHGIAVSHDGKYVWVALDAPASLLELDAATGKILHQWNTGQKRTHMVVPAADERKFYVTNLDSGSVSVIDRSTGEVKMIPVGPGSEGLTISPAGREVWVGIRDADKISVISTVTDQIVATFSSGGKRPVRVRFTPDGAQVWVSNTEDLTIFDAHSRNLLGTLAVTGKPEGLVFSHDGRRLYVANSSTNQVTVIDVAARKILSTFSTGTEPDGLAWAAGR